MLQFFSYNKPLGQQKVICVCVSITVYTDIFNVFNDFELRTFLVFLALNLRPRLSKILTVTDAACPPRIQLFKYYSQQIKLPGFNIFCSPPPHLFWINYTSVLTQYMTQVDTHAVKQDKVDSLTNNILCKGGVISPSSSYQGAP